MPSKSKSSTGRTRSSKDKPVSLSSPCKPKTTSAHSHYLVVDTTLPSHIINDRSLFTSYTPGRKVHRTVFGHDIIVEGTGDAHIRVFAAGQYICFRMRNCWHIPSSPHHFLSCATVTSSGHQVLITARTPRILFPHNCRLAEPKLPKYVPLAKVDGCWVLTFEIPAQGSISTQPLSTATRTAVKDTLSLCAITYQPFAGLALANRHPLPASQQVSLIDPCPSTSEVLTAAGAHEHHDAIVMTSDTSADAVILDGPGGAHALRLMDMDGCFPLIDMNVMSSGGAELPDGQILMPVVSNVTVDGMVRVDAEDQAAVTYGGDLDTRLITDFLATFNFPVPLSTSSSPRTSILSRSFIPISYIDLPCFPSLLPFSCKKFSFLLSVPPFPPCISSLNSTFNSNNTTCLLYSSLFLKNNNFPLHFSPLLSFHSFTPFSTLTLFESYLSTPVQHSHISFSPPLSGFSILFHSGFPSSRPHDSDSTTISPSSLHFDFSSLSSINFSLQINFSRPTSSRLNLISSTTSAISLHAWTFDMPEPDVMHCRTGAVSDTGRVTGSDCSPHNDQDSLVALGGEDGTAMIWTVGGSSFVFDDWGQVGHQRILQDFDPVSKSGLKISSRMMGQVLFRDVPAIVGRGGIDFRIV